MTPYWASEEPPLVVDPGWLLKALGAAIVLALVCAYAVICILFVKTQWQLVLHPVHTEAHQPKDFGLNAETVQFGSNAAGQPQLRGWWIASSAPAARTVLMLPGGDGSAGDLLERAKTFEEAGLNVLLFDYRGFGHSLGQHPTEQTMTQDSESALTFLEHGKAVPAEKIVVYGEGAGASLAVRLCGEHRDLPALVLESPKGDFAQQVRGDKRVSLVPFRLLFTQTFPLADPLHTLATPKLLVTYGAQPPEAVTRAAQPKLTVELPGPGDETDWVTTLRRFLDSYSPRQ